MPPSPVKRYRQKSRLRRGDAGADLRQRALDMAQKGLNRRGGPVDKGSPAEQKQAADRLKNEHAQALGEMQHRKQVEKRAAQTDQRPDYRAFQLHKNTTGNERSGGLFRRVPAKGGEYHRYAGGRQVFVRKPAASRTTGPTEGTGNRTKPATRGAEDLANQLAKQRATQNRPKARRKLLSISRS
jgi:hypothetical protein